MKPLAPSELFRRLLARLLGPSEEDALGDLDEEFTRRVRLHGRAGSELWYTIEAVSLVAAILKSRSGSRKDSVIRVGPIPGVARSGLGLGHDLRHVMRSLRRDATWTAVIITTLAVAIGATTTIMAVVNAAFLQSLPYPDADRLVRVYSGSREDPEATMRLSPLDIRDLRGSETVERLGIWTVGESVHLTSGDEPLRLEAPRASASLFTLLGLEPEIGRFFTPGEEEPGSADAIVLSHPLWVEAFGADPGVVGRSIRLDEREYRVVGVAPAKAALPPDADIWRALALGPEWYDSSRWGWQFLDAVALLRAGIEPPAASEALTTRLAESAPERFAAGQTRVVRTLHEERIGASGTGILLLLGAVALLLLMACANVMNMVLARAELRVGEFALRRALGSGPGRLVRSVALETGVLGVLGGIGGLLLAHAGTGMLRDQMDIAMLPYLESVGVDIRVAGFALLLTIVTAAIFGIAPVLKATRTDAQLALHDRGARPGTSRAARRVRHGLVVAQVSVACTLLVSVGLCASAFATLVDRDPGFRADGVLTATIELPVDAYPGEQAGLFYRSLVDSPIGHQVVVGALARQPATIVGVVGSLPDETVTGSGNGHVYFPVLQRAARQMALVVRTDDEPTSLARALRTAVRAADPRIPLTDVMTLVVLGGVALLAALVPATRATTIDPARALRAE